MLTGITLDNFKAFKAPQYIPIKPLTLIFGPNSAGKSSIIQALALIKHAFLNKGHAEADRIDMGWSEFRLGGWQNLVHGHDGNASFKIGLRFEANRPAWQQPSDGLDLWEVTWGFGRLSADSEAMVISCEGRKNALLEFEGKRNNERQCLWDLEFAGCSAKCAEFAEHLIKHAEPKFSTEQRSIFEDWIAVSVGKNLPFDGLFPDSQLPETRSNEDRNWSNTPPPEEYIREVLRKLPDSDESNWNLPERARDQQGINNAISSILAGRTPTPESETTIREVWVSWIGFHGGIYDSAARGFERVVNSHRHLGPVRDRPSGRISLAALPDLPKWEPWRRLLKDSKLLQSLNQALNLIEIKHEVVIRVRRILVHFPKRTSGTINNPDKIEIETSDSELAFIDNRTGVTVSQHDIGYGMSTIIPVLSSVLGFRSSLISIEQPELHIHPRLQAALGDAFIESALKRNNTLLIETHSEHLILRILRRIRETTENDFSTWSKELEKACPDGIRPEDVAVLYVEPGEDGARVKHLRINELGEFIDEWPGGFFDERMKEVF